MAEKNFTRAQKVQLRFLRRVMRELEEEAVRSLAHTKETHDALEACYRPAIDFAAVSARTECELRRILTGENRPPEEKDSCK